MCMAKAPKVKEPKEKEPTVIRNRYLDDALGLRRASQGRSSLRIDPGSTRAAPGSSDYVDYGPPVTPRSGPSTRRGSGVFGSQLTISGNG